MIEIIRAAKRMETRPLAFLKQTFYSLDEKAGEMMLNFAYDRRRTLIYVGYELYLPLVGPWKGVKQKSLCFLKIDWQQ